ncbi:hypothetical protein [Bacillus thuringiensis]|uniref:hypothetical protein n=1 Tax=Bacillus thuringiensis TaxID=1428 RepID=UPI000BFC3DFB|nr:hypothetical protein [Bacillus thuringiensis]PGU19073.1 hypothetical protein COD23_08570 [Bacillus thuringiensis]
MSRLIKVAKQAEQWLQNIKCSNSELMNLRDIGLMFCEMIFMEKNNKLNSLRSTEISCDYPEDFPLSLLQMKRNDILLLAMNMSLYKCESILFSKQEWAQIIGGVSLSYARHGDVPVVAALVRIAAILQLDSSLLADSYSYLLDQQEPDGTFGVFAREWELCSKSEEEEHIKLRLTVEVLWSLVEMSQMPLGLNQQMRFIV